MVSLQAAMTACVLLGAGPTVLLDFYSDSCGPCRAMDPSVQELVKMGYPVQKVNVEQNRALAARYGVRGVPCFVMLVDGQEADRVVGGTSFSRLERMCKLGSGGPSPQRSPSPVPMAARSKTAPRTAPMVPAALPIPPIESGLPLTAFTQQAAAGAPPAPGPADQQATVPGWIPRGGAAAKSDAHLIAASVRLRIEDPQGHSCGSGTIIDARRGEALILTCGHLFRDSKGKGRIEVDLFGPGGGQRVAGRLISYDLDRDLGLICIRPPGPVAVAQVAPTGYQVGKGAPVVTVGCNNGDRPSARHSRVASLNKYQGPPNLEVAGLPVEGRSGGGLFCEDGLVIGVCNAADPTDGEGLFAALESIHGVLDEAKLSFAYGDLPEEAPASQPAGTAPRTALAGLEPPPMPKRMPRLSSGWSRARPSEGLPSSAPPAPRTPPGDRPQLNTQEQAALDEIRQRLREGAEVVCVVRSRRDPQAKSEIIMLDQVSPSFLNQLAAEARALETSLEVPRAAPTEIPRTAPVSRPRPRGDRTGRGGGWRPIWGELPARR